MEIGKKINTLIAIGSLAMSVVGLMEKTFKWYEKKHGNKKEDYSRPIIKGI